MIKRQFISKSLIYTITGALPLASGLVLLPFYTNWLTSDQFGVFALYIAITMFLQVIFNFGFDNYIGISFIDNRNNPTVLSEIIGTIVLSLLFIGVFVILSSLLLGESIFNLFNNSGSQKTQLLFFPYGLMAVVTAFFNSMFKTYTSLLIYQQRSNKYMFMNLFNFILTISISLAWLSLNKCSLQGPMWGRLLSGLGIFLLAIFYFNKEYRLRFSSKYWSLFRKFCTFLVFYQLLSWTLSNIDKFIIGHFLSPTDVALFDFALKCLVVIEFLQNGLSSAIIPLVFSHWTSEPTEQSKADVRKYFNGFSAVSIISIPLYAIAVPLLVPLIVKNTIYYESFKFLPILGLGFMFISLRQIYSFPLLAKKRSDLLTKAFAFSAFAQVLLTVIAVKFFGLMGAVWVSLLTKPIQIIFMYIESRKIMKLDLSIKKQIILPILVTISVIIVYIIFPTNDYLLVLLCYAVIAALLTYFFYRKELPEFYFSALKALKIKQ
ncbi:MAG: lipopolysaccharide biosynthesis protein [Bacteroidales bacterium]